MFVTSGLHLHFVDFIPSGFLPDVTTRRTKLVLMPGEDLSVSSGRRWLVFSVGEFSLDACPKQHVFCVATKKSKFYHFCGQKCTGVVSFLTKLVL